MGYSLHILDTIKRVADGVDHYEGDDYIEHDPFDGIDETLFPKHTRLG